MFFKEKFQEEEWVRPKLDGVSFKAIEKHQNDRLSKPFTEKESTISELSTGKKTLNTCSTYTQTVLNLIIIGIAQQ